MNESGKVQVHNERTLPDVNEPTSPRSAEILSPSQVRCFMDCQVRWWFKYKLRVPEPPTGKMALGKAVHAALAHNFEQKLDTREDLPVPCLFAHSR